MGEMYYQKEMYDNTEYLEYDLNNDTYREDIAEFNAKLMIGSLLTCALLIQCGYCIEKCFYKLSKKIKQWFMYQNINENLIQENLSEQCSICLELFIKNEKLIQLECSHKFHKKCIQTWFSSNKENNCPLCRIII